VHVPQEHQLQGALRDHVEPVLVRQHANNES
jgi:hypothetical protein